MDSKMRNMEHSDVLTVQGARSLNQESKDSKCAKPISSAHAINFRFVFRYVN